ncbi:MAG: CvpA family protein [Cytophagales bacterium]|nr:CvpA family protein [Cytophagales bacterium]
MKPIDFILLIPLIYGAYDGYKKGFVMTVFTLLAIALGTIGAFKLLQMGIKMLQSSFSQMPDLLPFVAFMLIFLAIYTGVYLLGMALKQTLSFSIFAGTLDNTAGAIIGVLMWAFITGVLVWLIKISNFEWVLPYTDGAVIYDFLSKIPPRGMSLFTWLIPFSNHLFRDIKSTF